MMSLTAVKFIKSSFLLLIVQVLKLAHENVLAGHLGVNKTFHCITKYFFGQGASPQLQSFAELVGHLRGLANKTRRYPLQPVPVMAEPFERLILDCVGPLPKTKSGY